MINLEYTITGETCVNHIRALKETYVPEEDEKHRHCNGYDVNCPNYRPVKLFQIPINDLRWRS